MKSIRIFFSLCVLFLCLFCGTLLGRSQDAHSPSPVIVRAERFELINKAGRVCAFLGTDADGNPQMQFLNKQGKSVLSMSARSGGDVGLSINNNEFDKMILLSAAKESASVLIQR